MSIYPTATATRAAVFDDEREIRRAEIRHDPYELNEADNAAGQFRARRVEMENAFAGWFVGRGIDAVIGCGLLPSARVPGLYVLDGEFSRQMNVTHKNGRIINQGALIASHVANALSIRSFALVPFSVREMDAAYRISGVPRMNFGRLTHTLQIKNALRLAAADLGKPVDEVSLVIAYLGKNFSFCSHAEGRIVDFSNSFERGPFSQSRCGSVPATSVIRMAYSGMWSKMDLVRLVNSEGGAESYTGLGDLRAVISRARDGDAYSALVINALVYQVASEMASQATAINGKVDAVVMIGEFATDDFIARAIAERVSWISGRVLTYEGENELLTIARWALRSMRGEITPLVCAAIPGATGGHL
jgi:butyrate kinase